MTKNYDTCSHEWQFSIDAASSGLPVRKSDNGQFIPENKPWTSFYVCKNCQHSINFLEKNALDQLDIQSKSLKIQEHHTRIGMWANIISAITLVVAVVALVLDKGFSLKTAIFKFLETLYGL